MRRFSTNNRPFSRLRGLTVAWAAVMAAVAFGQVPAKKYDPPKTSWGDPDLQGTYTSDNLREVPTDRPVDFGTRRFLNDTELAARAQHVDDFQTEVVGKGIRPDTGYWANRKDRGVDGAAAPPNWQEFSRKASNLTSLVMVPENGRTPALTPEAQALRKETQALRNRRPEVWTDRSMYDRCISRGLIGSAFPVIYGNGTQIVQAPGVVAIRYEMIHETRIIPLDGRPHAGPEMRTIMGDSRGHWEGNTLVVDTTNFVGGRNGAGVNGNGAVPYSDQLHVVERFTRTSAKDIQYQATVTDPKTYTGPWTASFPINQEDGYQIFEYACHEGNYAMHNLLSAARAEDKADAAKAGSQK